MAILQDAIQQHIYIEYTIIDHRIDELEGSQLSFKYIQQGKVVYAQQFGWTNRTVHSFIHMLKHFPLAVYEGYYSHFEKHLEMKWTYNEADDHYTVQFLDADTVIVLKATQAQLIDFGRQFETEWHQSPVVH